MALCAGMLTPLGCGVRLPGGPADGGAVLGFGGRTAGGSADHGTALGCEVRPDGGSTDNDTVLVSLINVTSYEVTAVLSGILDDAVDTVRETVGPIDSVDIPFVCIDELVVGNPLDQDEAGVTINRDGEIVEIPPFSVSGRDWFGCGDVLEVIVSGDDPDSFVVDVFAFPAP